MSTQISTSPKPIASLSLDLDNKWSYLKTHGNSAWQTLPSYFPLLIPRVLDFLAEHQLTITFFVVGQDAAMGCHGELLHALSDAGHEIGNHSFHHEPWLHLYSESQINGELAQTEDAIIGATGQKPIGFRGPGYSCSEATLRVLVQRGYRYDASTLPTFIGPLARLYYFMNATLSAEEKTERSKLFGTVADGRRPLHAYRWEIPGVVATKSLVELPVTTMPLLRAPIHMSYLVYLSAISPTVALSYFRTALFLCQMNRVQPSLLLHPLDFMGHEDDADLAFFPGMTMARERKLLFVHSVLRMYATHYRVVTMQEHAQHAAANAHLPLVDARGSFAHLHETATVPS